jgi:hypothetical protein
MKTSKIILIALLALPVFSLAKDAPKFSGGFSSGKSTSTTKSQASGAKPKPVQKEAGTAKSSFGSFGSASTTKAATAPATPATTPAGATPGAVVPAAAKSNSALTQSLDKNAAQANALKTLDARNAQKTPVAIGSNIPPNSNVNPPAPVAPQPIPPQVVYQNAPASGWNSGIMGFLLGNALSRNDRSYNSQNGYNQPNSAGAGSAPDIAGKESTGSSFLRIVVWLLILGSIGGVIWYFVQRSSANNAATAAKRNYSL